MSIEGGKPSQKVEKLLQLEEQATCQIKEKIVTAKEKIRLRRSEFQNNYLFVAFQFCFGRYKTTASVRSTSTISRF